MKFTWSKAAINGTLHEIYAWNEDGHRALFPQDKYTREYGCSKVNTMSENQAREITAYYSEKYAGVEGQRF